MGQSKEGMSSLWMAFECVAAKQPGERGKQCTMQDSVPGKGNDPTPSFSQPGVAQSFLPLHSAAYAGQAVSRLHGPRKRDETAEGAGALQVETPTFKYSTESPPSSSKPKAAGRG